MQATKQLTFRLPVNLVDRVEHCVSQIQAHSGFAITRADVVRMLLTHALDEAGCDLRRLFAWSNTPAPEPTRRRRGK